MNGINFRGKTYKAQKDYLRGTHRTSSPGETLEKIRPHFKAIGLTRIPDITGLDRIGISTVLCVRPNSFALSVSSGKGLDIDAAKVSGAMECIEIYHALNVELPEIYLPYEKLREDFNVIPAENLALTKDALFNVHLPERWALGWDIINQNEVAAPVLAVSLKRAYNNPRELVSFQMGSNGLASGNHFLEAVSSGLFEVIERDAVACHAFASGAGRHKIPIVRLDTIKYPLVLELLDRFKSADVTPVLFDCTVDTEVPVYMSYIYDNISRHTGIFKGFGAHLDPEVAMLRALTEAAQGRLVWMAGTRDELYSHLYIRLMENDDEESIVRIESKTANVDASACKSGAASTIEGDIQIVLEKLKKAGLGQVIVFDLTRPEFGINTARVIVPGMEGYMFDYYTPGWRAKKFCGSRQQ